MRYMNRICDRVKRSLASRLKTFRTKNRARYKLLYQRFTGIGPPNKYIFIFGCQRSGTTLLERIFRHDYRSVVFGEFSELSIGIDRTAWKPLPEVQREFDICRASYVVARSLYESSRVSEILDFFPHSVAVWIYRDCRAVVDSMKRKWEDKFFDISRRVESNRGGEWSLQSMVDGINEEALQIVGKKVAIDDLYALYWLKRNEIFFKQNLDCKKNVLCLGYSSLVSYPDKCVNLILQKASLGLWRDFRTDVHTRSLYRECQANISRPIQLKCDEMLTRLDRYSNIEQ